MRRFLNFLISTLKGEPYKLSEDVPVSYLIYVLWNRFIMLIRGSLIFCKKKGFLFVGSGCTIRCRSKIRFGKNVTIYKGCYFDALSYNGINIGSTSTFGKYCIVECTGNLKFLGKGLNIGEHVAVGSGSFLGCAGGIEIGSNTIIGNYVTFHSENHNYSDKSALIRLQGVTHRGIRIGENCWIGAKVTVLDGVIVEDGCVIAAGALLIKATYKKDSIYGGVPARFIKSRI